LRNAGLTAYLLVHSVEGLVHDFVLRPPQGLEAGSFVDELVCMLHSYLDAADDPPARRPAASCRPARP